MSEFMKLTSREAGGGDLFIRKSMVAAVGSYSGKTHVTLINEDIDYEVRESVVEILRLLGETHEKSPLTVQTNCDKLSDRKDRQCKHHKYRQDFESGASPSSKKLDSRPRSLEPAVVPTDANAIAETKS